MKQVYLKFSMLLLCLVVGLSSAWAEDLTIDFESATSTYSAWVFSNITTQKQNSNVTAHGGDYFGTTNGVGTAYVYTSTKIADPSSITFYVSKQSTNTSSSNWKVVVTDGKSMNWNSLDAIKTVSATSMDRGVWVEVTADLSNYKNVYVGVVYSGATAVRCIDDLVLTTKTNTPSISVDVTSVNFGTVTTGSSVEGKEVNVTLSNVDEVLVGMEKTSSPFEVDKESLTASGKVVVTPKAETLASAGTYSDKLVITDADDLTKEVSVSIVVEDPKTEIAHTVSWSVNGTVNTENVIEGESITFANPSTTEIFGKKFVGWTTASISGTQDSAPTYVTSATMGTIDVTYYAVFAKETTGDATSWTKITSVSDVKEGTYAVISFDGLFYLPNGSATSGAPAVKEVSKTNGTINVSNDMKWNLTVTDGVFVLESASVQGSYLWGANTNEGIRIVSESAKGTPFKNWKLTATKDYGLVIVDAGTYGRYLSTYSTNDWRNYTTTSKTNRAANLYKLGNGTSYSAYCTTVTEEDIPSTGSVTFNSKATNNEQDYWATFSSNRAVMIEDAFVVGDEYLAAICVYSVTTDGDKLEYNELEKTGDYDNYYVIPENTGVLLKYSLRDDKTFTNGEVSFEYVANTNTTISNNLMKPASETMSADNYNYKLTTKNGANVGFYFGAEDGAPFEGLREGTAYLAIPKSATSAKSFVLNDIETAITFVSSELDANAPIYNIAGQRVNSNAKGILIQNGKKFINK